MGDNSIGKLSAVMALDTRAFNRALDETVRSEQRAFDTMERRARSSTIATGSPGGRMTGFLGLNVSDSEAFLKRPGEREHFLGFTPRSRDKTAAMEIAALDARRAAEKADLWMALQTEKLTRTRGALEALAASEKNAAPVIATAPAAATLAGGGGGGRKGFGTIDILGRGFAAVGVVRSAVEGLRGATAAMEGDWLAVQRAVQGLPFGVGQVVDGVLELAGAWDGVRTNAELAAEAVEKNRKRQADAKKTWEDIQDLSQRPGGAEEAAAAARATFGKEGLERTMAEEEARAQQQLAALDRQIDEKRKNIDQTYGLNSSTGAYLDEQLLDWADRQRRAIHDVTDYRIAEARRADDVRRADDGRSRQDAIQAAIAEVEAEEQAYFQEQGRKQQQDAELRQRAERMAREELTAGIGGQRLEMLSSRFLSNVPGAGQEAQRAERIDRAVNAGELKRVMERILEDLQGKVVVEVADL